MVRKLFISSAVALVEDFHLDGFRVDQTTSMHAYNVLHADGRPLGNVNAFGAKFLREYCRTLKMIKPQLFLIAEDHSGWDMVTRPVDEGGLGFDATWYADFYHHLVGTQARTGSYACLVHRAAGGGDDELPMERFADALRGASNRRVVYHESHDEAGNADGSGRTMNEAVRWAPMTDSTRRYAEARTRFAVGMALTSPGTPMFFMGEEVASTRDFKYRGFRFARQDLEGEAKGTGRGMFQFYRDAIELRRGLTSRNNAVVYVHNGDRIVAFRRWGDNGEYLVVGSLSNRPFDRGYTIQGVAGLDGQWREVLNSDAGVYGGANVGNQSGIVTASNGSIRLNIPANGVVVLQRQ
jgi:1,4-alpha-glucan branching enzyme